MRAFRDSASVQANSGAYLLILAKHGEHDSAIVASGVIPAVVKSILRPWGEPHVYSMSCSVLLHLAMEGNPAIHTCLVEGGGVEALVAVMKMQPGNVELQ